MQITLNYKNVVFTSVFQKSIKKIDFASQKLILLCLDEILKGKKPQDVRKLKNYPYAEYRLKLGTHRVLFDYDKDKKKYLFISCKARKILY